MANGISSRTQPKARPVGEEWLLAGSACWLCSVHSCLMEHKISSVEVQLKVGECRWGRMENMRSVEAKLPWQELRLCYLFWAQQVLQARTDVLQKYTWEFHHPAPESSPQLWLKPNIFSKKSYSLPLELWIVKWAGLWNDPPTPQFLSHWTLLLLCRHLYPCKRKIHFNASV